MPIIKKMSNSFLVVSDFFMARTPSGKDWKVPLTIRIDPDFDKEMDYISEEIMSKKASFLVECIKVGFEELKKRKTSIKEAAQKYESYMRQPQKRAV